LPEAKDNESIVLVQYIRCSGKTHLDNLLNNKEQIIILSIFVPSKRAVFSKLYNKFDQVTSLYLAGPYAGLSDEVFALISK
jgi:hypothetical protein